MLDGWTAPNVLSIVGLVIQYVKDHKLKTFLLDMRPCVLFLFLNDYLNCYSSLSISHTGINLARAIADALQEYEIEAKVCTLIYCSSICLS